MSALGDALRAQAVKQEHAAPFAGEVADVILEGARQQRAIARVLDAADGLRAWTRGDGLGQLQDVRQTYDAAVADALKAPGVSK